MPDGLTSRHALAVYKSESLVEMRQAATVVQGLLDVEMRLHVEFCAGWGMSEAEMEELPEATGTMAYAQTGAGFLGAGSRKAFVHHGNRLWILLPHGAVT